MVVCCLVEEREGASSGWWVADRNRAQLLEKPEGRQERAHGELFTLRYSSQGTGGVVGRGDSVSRLH